MNIRFLFIGFILFTCSKICFCQIPGDIDSLESSFRREVESIRKDRSLRKPRLKIYYFKNFKESKIFTHNKVYLLDNNGHIIKLKVRNNVVRRIPKVIEADSVSIIIETSQKIYTSSMISDRILANGGKINFGVVDNYFLKRDSIINNNLVSSFLDSEKIELLFCLFTKDAEFKISSLIRDGEPNYYLIYRFNTSGLRKIYKHFY